MSSHNFYQSGAVSGRDRRTVVRVDGGDLGEHIPRSRRDCVQVLRTPDLPVPGSTTFGAQTTGSTEIEAANILMLCYREDRKIGATTTGSQHSTSKSQQAGMPSRKKVAPKNDQLQEFPPEEVLVVPSSTTPAERNALSSILEIRRYSKNYKMFPDQQPRVSSSPGESTRSARQREKRREKSIRTYIGFRASTDDREYSSEHLGVIVDIHTKYGKQHSGKKIPMEELRDRFNELVIFGEPRSKNGISSKIAHTPWLAEMRAKYDG